MYSRLVLYFKRGGTLCIAAHFLPALCLSPAGTLCSWLDVPSQSQCKRVIRVNITAFPQTASFFRPYSHSCRELLVCFLQLYMQKQMVFPAHGNKLNNITKVWSEPFHYMSRDTRSWDLLSLNYLLSLLFRPSSLLYPLFLHYDTFPVWRLQCPPLILVGKTTLCTHYKPDLLSFLGLMREVELPSEVTL